MPPEAPGRDIPLEMNEVAEGLRDDDVLPHGDLSAPDLRRVDVPPGPRVAARGPLEQLERRRCASAKRGVGSRIQRVTKKEPVDIGCRPGRAERRLVQLIEMVQHGVTSRLESTIQRNAASRNQMVILC